jgi:deoxyribose-phosphate aldolase
MPLSDSELHAMVRAVLDQTDLRRSQTPVMVAAARTADATTMAAMIDHTLLKADANDDQIRELCAQAVEYHFAAVCVNSTWIPLCASLLVDSGVGVATTAGFPLGASLASAKAAETAQAVAAGATEIDMVLNVGALKSRLYSAVEDDVAAVVQAAHPRAIVKVIIETCYLTREEKVAACLLCKAAGADFVKTSTGFGPAGATVEDVALMRLTVGPELGVKAAGGVRSAADAVAMVTAGATRIGTSAGVKIIGELMAQSA